MDDGGARRSNPARNTQPKQYHSSEALEGSATSSLNPKNRSFKKAATKNKGINVRTMPPRDFLVFRTRNHYLEDKAQIKNIDHVWSRDHCMMYRDIIKPFKKIFVPVQWIDLAHLRRNPDYFGEALSLIEKLGLTEIITFRQDFDPDVVA